MSTKSYTINVTANVDDLIKQMKIAQEKMQKMANGVEVSDIGGDFRAMQAEFDRILNKMQDDLNELKIHSINVQKMDLSPVEELFTLLKNINDKIKEINTGLNFSDGVQNLASNLTQIKEAYMDVLSIVETFGGSITHKTNLTPEQVKTYLNTYKQFAKIQQYQKPTEDVLPEPPNDDVYKRAIDLFMDYTEARKEVQKTEATIDGGSKKIKDYIDLGKQLTNAQQNALELRNTLLELRAVTENYVLPNKQSVFGENGFFNDLWTDIDKYKERAEKSQKIIENFLRSRNIDVDEIAKTKAKNQNIITIPVSFELTEDSNDIVKKIDDLITAAKKRADLKKNVIKLSLDYDEEKLKKLKETQIKITLDKSEINTLKRETLKFNVDFEGKNLDKLVALKEVLNAENEAVKSIIEKEKTEEKNKQNEEKRKEREKNKKFQEENKKKEESSTTKAKKNLETVETQADKTANKIKITEKSLVQLIAKIAELTAKLGVLDTVTPLNKLNESFKELSNNIAIAANAEDAIKKKKKNVKTEQPDDIKLLAQTYMTASKSICNSIDLIIGKLGKLDKLDKLNNLENINISFDSTKLEKEIKSVLQVITTLMRTDFGAGIKQSTEKMEQDILSAFKDVVQELKSSNSFKEIANSFEQSTERMEKSVLELILKLDSSFDALGDSIKQLNSSNAIANIGISFENMSNKAVESIHEIISEIKSLDTAMRTGFGLPSKSDLALDWIGVKTTFASKLNDKGKLDLRKKGDLRDIFDFYTNYKNNGGEKDFNDLTEDKKLAQKLTLRYNKDYGEFNTEKNFFLKFKTTVEDLSNTIKTLDTNLASFTEANKNFISQLSAISDLLRHNFTYGGGSKNRLHFNLKTSTDPNDFIENQDEIRKAIESMFSKNSDVASAMDLKLTRSTQREKGPLGDFETELYEFAGRYKNIMGEIVEFNGKVDSEGHLVGNMKTHILDTKDFSDELKQIEKNKKRYEKAIEDFQKVDKDFIEQKTENDKIGIYDKTIEKFTKDYRFLQEEAFEIINKDVTLVNESDIERLEIINIKLKELDKQISNLQKDTRYDLFNKNGSTIAEDLDFQEARQQAIKYAQTKGEMLKTLSFTEPKDGFSKFTTEIKTQTGEVKKLDFVWDHITGTLRESTKTLSTVTSFGDFQKSINSFESIEKESSLLFEKLDAIDILTRTEDYEENVKTKIQSIKQLIATGIELKSKDIKSFVPDDLDKLENIKLKIKEYLLDLQKLYTSTKYDISNNQGNLLLENVNYEEAINKAQEYARIHGQLLKSMSIQEPVNGIAKFTAEVKNQAGEVKKLSFVWDEVANTLRETTKITGATTDFGFFQNQLKTFGEIEKKVLHSFEKLDNIDATNKAESYQKEVNTVVENIKQLMIGGTKLKEKDIDLFTSEDVHNLENINVKLKEYLTILQKIYTSNKYDISNNQGNLLVDNIDYSEALNKTQEFIKNRGKLLNNITIQEPINGIAKFTAEIENHVGQVEKLSFVWDETSRTLRESTKTMGYVSLFEDLKDFSKLEKDIKSLSSTTNDNKTKLYYEQTEPIKEELKNLLNIGKSIQDMDINLISEENIFVLENVITRARELIELHKKLDTNDNYNLSNKNGNVVEDGLSYQKAIETAKKRASLRGEMLEGLQYSEPINGISKMSTLIRTENGEVQKLTFTWDQYSLALRETATVRAKNYSEIKNEFETFNKLQENAIEKLLLYNETDKTDAYKTDVKEIDTTLKQLIERGNQLEQKDLDLFDESDLFHIKNVNNELEKTVSLLGKTLSNDKYNKSNKDGNLIGQDLNYEAAEKEISNFLNSQGQLLKDISFTEPTNGMAKFTAEVMNNEGVVKRISFVWDEVNKTLRETTKILGNGSTTFSKIQNNLNTFSELSNSFNNLQIDYSGKTNSFEIEIEKEKNKIKELISYIEQLKSKDINLFDENDLFKTEKAISSLKESLKTIGILSRDSRFNLSNKQGDVIKQNINFKQALKEVEKIASTKGKLLKDIQYTEPINGAAKFTAELKTQTGVVEKLKFVWDDTSKSLRQTTEIMGGSSTGFSGFINNIKQGFSQFGAYFGAEDILQEIIQLARDGINEVKELDAAFTEMQKVSDESVRNLKRFSKESFNIGRTIGSTGLDIQKSTADWMRLGYQLNDASTLAKNTALYANVGDMDIDTATEHLISSVKAFGKEFGSEVEASTAIVDKFNEIGNNFAITSADIGSSFERSAAALVAGGNNIDEALGLTTAGNLIQQNAESVGNALKVVSLRVRGAKTDLEEMGESTDGMIGSTSKLRDELLGLTGVDIMKNANEFKSTYQIFDELASVWDNLTDINQANVLEKLAGKTRSSVVAGLLDNFQVARDVVNDAANAEGSAIEENQKHLSSIEGHIDLLKNKWQEMWSNAINRDVLNFFIDLGTGILSVIDKLGMLPTALGTASFWALQQGGGSYEALESFRSGKAIDKALKADSGKKLIEQIGIVQSNFDLSKKGVNLFDGTDFDQFGKASKTLKENLMDLAQTGQIVNLSSEDVAKGFEKMGVSAAKSAAQTAIMNVGMNLAVSGCLALASALIGIVIKAIDNYIHKQEEVIKVSQEAAEQMKTQREEMQQGASWVETNAKRYEELGKGVQNGMNMSLTNSEFEEFKRLNQELAGIFPDLVQGYSSLGVAIINTAKAHDVLNNKVSEQKKELAKNARTNENKIMKGYKETLNKYTGIGESVQTGSKKDLYSKITDGKGKVKDYEDFILQLGKSDDKAVLDLFKEYGVEGKKASAAYASQTGKSWILSEKDYKIIKNNIQTYNDKIKKELKKNAKEVKQNMVDQLWGKDTFSQLDSKAQSGIQSIINNMDVDAFTKNLEKHNFSIKDWVDSMFKGVNSEDLQKQLNSILTINPNKINKTNIKSYEAKIKNLAKTLHLKKEDLEDFKIGLGIDKKSLDTAVAAAKDNIKSKFKDFKDEKWLNSLNLSDLEIIGNVDMSKVKSIKDLKTLLEEIKEDSLISIDIAVNTEKISKLKDIFSESNGSIGLTNASINELVHIYGDKAYNALEKTANGVKLNTEAFAALGLEQERLTKVKMLTQLQEQQEGLKNAQEALKNTGFSYEDVKNNVGAAKDKVDEWNAAVSASVAIDSFSSQIQQTELLISQYDGLTSAYNKWINAQETENKNSHMQKAREGLDAAKKSYKQSWTTEDDYTTYMDYIGSYEQSNDNYVKNASKLFKRAKKYLTEDASGVQRFAKELKKLGTATDDTGKKFTFNLDEVAQKLDMTTAFVTDMVSAMGGAGYEVHLDSTSLEDFSKKAEEAKKNLKELEKNKKIEITVDLDYDVNKMNMDQLIQKKEELTDYKLLLDADSPQLKEVNSLIDEITAKLTLLELATINVTVNGKEDVQTLAEKIATLPKDEKANITVKVKDKEQLSAVKEELAKIPSETEANVKVTVPNEEAQSSLEKLIEELNSKRKKPINLEAVVVPKKSSKKNDKKKDKKEPAGVTNETITQTITVDFTNKKDFDDFAKAVKEIERTFNCTISLNLPELLLFQINIQQLKTLTETPIIIQLETTIAKQKIDELKKAISSLSSVEESPKITVDTVTATSQVGKLQAVINSLKGKSVDIKVNPKNSHEVLNGILNKIRSMNSKTITITTKYETKGSPSGNPKPKPKSNDKKEGKGGVNGTAHVLGTAFANGTLSSKGKALAKGNWGLRQDVDQALVGELGQEILVRDGHWMTVGDNGAEFIGGLKKGDIIFNHKQSEELLNKGYVTSGGGRGRAFVEGTKKGSSVTETDLVKPVGGSGKPGKKPSKKPSKNSKKDAKDAKDAAEEIIDWIATLLEYVARQTKLAVDAIDDAVGLVAKQAATNKAISKVQKEIAENQRAKEAYLKKANSVGLSASYKNKVQNGTLNIEEIKDENLRKKIEDYEKWYKEAEKCSDALIDLRRQEKELNKRRLENIEEWYDAIVDVHKSMIDIAEAKQELNEALGTAINHDMNVSEINKAIKEQTDSYNQLVQKLNDYQVEFDKQVASGKIKQNSDEWFEGKQKINEFTANIYEASKELIEFKDKLRQIEYDTIQYIIDGLERAVSRIDSKIELMEARDEKIPEELYKEQISYNDEQIQSKFQLRNKKLQEQALYDVNSVRYQELAKEIADLDEETRQLMIDNEKLKDSIFELRFSPLDKAIEKYKDLRSETDAFYDLLNEQAFFDKNGIITEDGLAGLALLQQSMATAKQEIADYKTGLNKLQESLDNNVISQEEYDEKSKEYIKGIQDAVANVKDYEKSLTDLYMTQMKTEVEALDKIIAKRKEALDKKAEYYEYDKRLKNETKDVNMLKAQIAALEGVNNATAQAELKRLKEQLGTAEDKLNETKREHALNMQKEGYDGLSKEMQQMLEDTEYEIIHNADKQQQIIQGMLKNVVGMYSSAYDKINSIIHNTGWVGSNDFNKNQSELGTQAGAQSQFNNSTQHQSIVGSSSTANETITNKIPMNTAGNSLIESELDKKPNTTNRPVAEIAITPNTITLQEGTSKTIQVTVRPNDARNKSLRWSSSNSSVATVSGSTVRGNMPGSCQIVATSTDGSGVTASATVTVTRRPAPSAPPVTPSHPSTPNKPSGNGGGDGKAQVGDRVTLKKGQRYYYDSYGQRPAGSKYAGVKNGVIIDSRSGTKYGGSTKRYGNYGVHIRSADGKYKDLGWVKLDQIEGYEHGAKRINEDKFAWTNENGREMIIRKSDGAVLTQLNRGDGVIPNNLTENLFKWGSINPSQLIYDKLNSATSAVSPHVQEINIELKYDNFLNIDGGTITKDSIPAIKDLAKEVTPYITDHMYKELKKKGFYK